MAGTPPNLGLPPKPGRGNDESESLRPRKKDAAMNLLLRLACLQLALVDPPAQAPQPVQQPSSIDLVSALENVVSDAIARAEPSVVAIHREKGDNPQETLAVRGRKRPGAAFEPGRPRSRF